MFGWLGNRKISPLIPEKHFRFYFTFKSLSELRRAKGERERERTTQRNDKERESRESEPSLIIVALCRSRSRLCANRDRSTMPRDLTPRSHPSTSPANPEPRSRIQLRRDCTPGSHRDDTDRTEIAEKWLGFDEFDRIWWIFFLLGFVSVFIYWEMVLYICLEAEKNVRNKKKMCFLYYF